MATFRYNSQKNYLKDKIRSSNSKSRSCCSRPIGKAVNYSDHRGLAVTSNSKTGLGLGCDTHLTANQESAEKYLLSTDNRRP